LFGGGGEAPNERPLDSKIVALPARQDRERRPYCVSNARIGSSLTSLHAPITRRSLRFSDRHEVGHRFGDEARVGLRVAVGDLDDFQGV
jgi:hypothetical protein